MIAPAQTVDESERIAELYKYELLDTAYEQDFDDIVTLASNICQVPISLITLVDMDRQWFKAKHGLAVGETSRDISFCGHAILNNNLFEVEDAAADERFHDNPLVLGDPNIRYYAGMPLVTGSGYKIGTLCVIDSIPRKLSDDQAYAMKVLSKQIIKLFELRMRNKELKKISGVQQQIITILAHDIRNPLAAIKMSLEMKIDGSLPPDVIKEIDDLSVIQLAGTLDLLDNVVDWGNLQMAGSRPAVSSFSLYDVCEQCFSQILLAARSKNNVLVNNVDQQLKITGNKQGMSFMLRNIIINANKFTTTGQIIVSAMVTKNDLIISVKDTGVGMSEKAQRSLKERSWSATELGTQSEKGSGVGLKLIFEYLRELNGNIDFLSAPGQGTTVVISMPFIIGIN